MNATFSETQLRVRYAETDQMGVVYHSNYVIWFEVGRVETLRKLGLTYKQLEQQGCHLPVVEVRCRYKAPARYDDLITVRTRLKKVRSNLIRFGYEIVRSADGTLLAEGETVHLTLDDQGERRAFPEQYLAALQNHGL
jgi:acyl-CoA thioester hydrolase